MFSFYKPHNNSLYNKLVELSRNIFFYKTLYLEDKFETRIILIFIHLSVILNLTKNNKKNKLTQIIFDNIFHNIEYHLRELGYGDVAVNSKMKILNRIFYDILLKLAIYENEVIKVNKNKLKEHLFINIDLNDQHIDKFVEYLDKFYNYCFELDHNIMLKGRIKFKFI
jgi:hypothetical protein|tara:strand:+ start:541 stop:1044 length:504 start_codon:yes stop_codon:yes gene_type:complete